MFASRGVVQEKDTKKSGTDHLLPYRSKNQRLQLIWENKQAQREKGAIGTRNWGDEDNSRGLYRIVLNVVVVDV